MRLSLAIAALAVCAAGAAAQAPAKLIGLTQGGPLIRTQNIQNCQVTTSCSLAGSLPPASQPWSGGSAFDASSGGLWVSEGTRLARVRPGDCTVECGPYPVPSIGGAGVITGLALSEVRNELLLIDSNGTITTMSLTGSCSTPAVVSSCNTGLRQVGNRATTGLALDDKNDLLFYSYTSFTPGTLGTRIFVAQLGSNCTQVFSGVLPTCGSSPFGAVRGLAVDWCQQYLYTTDGLNFVVLRYRWDAATGTFAFGAPRCCTPVVVTPNPFAGLAILPGGGTRVGQPCANGACRICPMRHGLVTAPEVGNPNLVLGLDDAQDGSLTWLALGFGHCRNSGPVIPPLCGPILLPRSPRPLVAGPFPVVSTSATRCSASARVTINVPDDPNLCGTRWSSMFISLCVRSGAIGTGLSNCLSWDLGGS